MSFTRVTITFPQDLATRVRRCASRRGFSAFLAKAAQEKLLREDTETLKTKLREAYTLAAKEDQALADDWGGTLGDGL